MPQIKRAPKRLVDLDDISGLLTALADGYVLTYDHDTGEFVLLPGGTMSASDILTAVKTVDGTGSGLDADYLDGNNADAFATSGHTHEVDQRADVFSDAEGDPAVIGTAADGVSTYAARRDHVHDVNAATIRGKGFFDTSNDGTGSGLDADLLDGSHASAFAASGHAHSGTYQPLDADLTAIADNTVTEEATPASGDFALGWTAEGTLRKYNVGNLPASGGTDDQTAAEVPFTPAGNIEATDVQAAIQELDGEKAATSHTHAVGDVTTLYSDAEGDPAGVGSTADGISSHAARRDHSHDVAAETLRTKGFFDTSNDGTGSGLDADLLDGSHASAFAVAAHTHEVDERADVFSDAEGDPADVGTTADGTSTYAARRNHVHAHGNQAGGSLHSEATTSVAGFLSASDKTKLDGVENGATADQSASEILTAVKTVDGTGSGLDADLLDGNEASVFATLTGTQTLTNKTLTAPALTLLGLTSGTTVNWDMSAGTSAFLQLSHNATLAAPTNVPANGIGWLQVVQAGYTLAFNSAYYDQLGDSMLAQPAGVITSIYLVVIRSSMVYLINQSPVVKQVIPLSAASGDIATGTAVNTWDADADYYMVKLPRIAVSTANTGSVLTVDINEGGTSMLSTKITNDAGEYNSDTAATAAVLSDHIIAKGSKVVFDIDTIGSTVAGSGLECTLFLREF